jgi:hypothetical protein
VAWRKQQISSTPLVMLRVTAPVEMTRVDGRVAAIKGASAFVVS